MPPRNCTNSTVQDGDDVGVLSVAGLISLDIRLSVLKSEKIDTENKRGMCNFAIIFFVV